MSLALARDRAAGHRLAIAEGRDSDLEKRRDAAPTFARSAETVHALNRPRWRSANTPTTGGPPSPATRCQSSAESRWTGSTSATCWGARADLDGEPRDARRVPQRIRAAIKWALAHRYVEHNPTGECIDGALPPMPKVKTNLRALPYAEIAAALETVQSSTASPAAKACFRRRKRDAMPAMGLHALGQNPPLVRSASISSQIASRPVRERAEDCEAATHAQPLTGTA